MSVPYQLTGNEDTLTVASQHTQGQRAGVTAPWLLPPAPSALLTYSWVGWGQVGFKRCTEMGKAFGILVYSYCVCRKGWEEEWGPCGTHTALSVLDELRNLQITGSSQIWRRRRRRMKQNSREKWHVSSLCLLFFRKKMTVHICTCMYLGTWQAGKKGCNSSILIRNTTAYLID